jgi:hypothetical protein
MNNKRNGCGKKMMIGKVQVACGEADIVINTPMLCTECDGPYLAERVAKTTEKFRGYNVRSLIKWNRYA